MSDSTPTDRIGLIAGWGRYPLVLAEVMRQQGRSVVCLAVKGHADRALRDLCDDYYEVGLGQLGKSLRILRRHQVTVATMAGKIHKVVLFRPYVLWTHFPDWRGARTYFPYFAANTRDRRDDTLLRAIVTALAEEGVTVVPATEFLPEVLVKYGVLARRRLSRSEAKDVEFGWRIAKEMGRLDIGQTVVVKSRAVMAIEAIEGTDQCIRRAGQLCEAGGFTVVKVAKPNQDMRFDVPTFGVGTMESLVAAGGRVLAVEADKTILIDEAEVIDFANRHGIAIVAIRDGACERVESRESRVKSEE
ncbi:MAG: LpxI family protein [Pirellulaceae bacterium]